MVKVSRVPLILLCCAGLLCGCGNGSRSSIPDTPPAIADPAGSCNTTAPQAETTSAFTIKPTATDVTVYPGGVTAVVVEVGPGGTTKGNVSVAMENLPTGLTVAPVQAAIGSSAVLILKAATNLATECFTGQPGVYTATIPLGVKVTGVGGEAETVLSLNVVLTNPYFAPAKTDLPTLQITTANLVDITSKDDYVSGAVVLSDPKNSSNDYSGTMQIKGHGNSTWGMPKKPYNLKLDSKAGLLGMASDKKWVLLANYDDKTMLRDALASHISEMFGMTWTPDSRFVELYLNGAYNGTYQLSEKVEIDNNRLNITEMDDTDNSGKALTGGYLLEIDHYYGDTFWFTTPEGLPVGSDDPDPPTTAQGNYISSTTGTAENALFSANFTDSATGWPAYFDQDSLVKWFLVEELMGNQDGNFWSSDYFYKQKNDPRLYMGPIWDFDISSGNVNYSASIDPTQPWIRTQALWYTRLFQDPAFLAAVQAQWTATRSQVGGINAFIDSSAASLALAQTNNYQRWPTLSQQVWPNPQAAGSYQGEVDYLKAWMTKRVAYMDANYLK